MINRAGFESTLIPLTLAAAYLSYAVVSWPVAANPQAIRKAPATSGAPASAPSGAAGVDYADMAGWHLFGDAASGLSENPVAASLALTVQGIVMFPGRRAHVIVSTPDQAQKTYKVRDQLPGGYTITAIERDRIRLSDVRPSGTGRHEYLALPKNRL